VELLLIITEISKIIFFVAGTIAAIFTVLNYTHQIELTKIKRKSAEITLDILLAEQFKK